MYLSIKFIKGYDTIAQTGQLYDTTIDKIENMILINNTSKENFQWWLISRQIIIMNNHVTARQNIKAISCKPKNRYLDASRCSWLMEEMSLSFETEMNYITEKWEKNIKETNELASGYIQFYLFYAFTV